MVGVLTKKKSNLSVRHVFVTLRLSTSQKGAHAIKRLFCSEMCGLEVAKMVKSMVNTFCEYFQSVTLM